MAEPKPVVRSFSMRLGDAERARASRAHVLFEGVEQAGPSFEARVFVNNEGADETTPQDERNGYVGTFSVYGQGARAAAEAAARGEREGGPIAPISKRVEAGNALGRALAAGDDPVITVVAVPRGPVGEGLEASLEHTRATLVVDT